MTNIMTVWLMTIMTVWLMTIMTVWLMTVMTVWLMTIMTVWLMTDRVSLLLPFLLALRASPGWLTCLLSSDVVPDFCREFGVAF